MTLQADTLLLITDGGKDAQLFIKLEYMCLIGGSWKKKSRLLCKISCPLTTSNCSGFMSWFEIQSIYYIARKMWGTWRINVKPKGMLNLAKTSLNIAPVMEHTADSSFLSYIWATPKINEVRQVNMKRQSKVICPFSMHNSKSRSMAVLAKNHLCSSILV